MKIALSLALAVAGFWLGWMLGPGRDAAPARAGGERDVVARAEFDRQAEALAEARTRNDALAAQVAALEEAAAAPSPATPAPAPPPAEAPDAAGPRFVFAGTEDALRSLDWEAIGSSLRAMPPLLAELTDALAEGKPFPASVGEIQRWNGPLVTQALKLQQQGVPGSGVNGAFSHPAMLANMIYAALAKSPEPLTGAQQEELSRVGMRFLEEDARRLAAYGDATLALRKLLDETALKDRFLASVEEMLTEPQRTLLRPESTRGYVGVDLYGSGIVWAQFARTLEFQDRAHLAEKVVDLHLRHLGMPDTAAPAVEAAVATWARGLPDELLSVPMTPAIQQGRLMRTAHVRTAAAHQLALRRALLGAGALPEDAAQKLREEMVVFVPYRK